VIVPFINVAFFSHTSSCGVLLRIVERMSESVTTTASSRQERLSEYCEDRERGRCVAEAELGPWAPWASRLLLYTPYIQVSRLLGLSIQCAFALVRSPYTLVDLDPPVTLIRISGTFTLTSPARSLLYTAPYIAAPSVRAPSARILS